MSRSAPVDVVVPSLGLSPWLAAALESIAAQRAAALRTVFVWQGSGSPPPAVARFAGALVACEANLGFSRAVNRGIAGGDSPFVAVVNDDVLLEPDWLAHLAAALEAAPAAAAAQGVNLKLGGAEGVDGCGLGWNRFWQAVQLGHGFAAPAPGPPREIFGASATAALFRRSALAQVAAPGEEFFDPALFAYYEDVDLACRLRGKGHGALLAPAARARHAGSATAERLAGGRTRWVYGHRLAVLARLFGRAFWPRLPWLLARDLADLARRRAPLAGVLAGWRLALALLPRFARRGPPLVAVATLKRFRVGSRGWNGPA